MPGRQVRTRDLDQTFTSAVGPRGTIWGRRTGPVAVAAGAVARIALRHKGSGVRRNLAGASARRPGDARLRTVRILPLSGAGTSGLTGSPHPPSSGAKLLDPL